MRDPSSSRYSRQALFPPIGRAGQERLLASRIAIVGCGALGAALGEMSARAGVGSVRLVDRDIVESSNLGRQSLYTERDASEGLPKSAALRRHLAEFNPETALEVRVADVHAANVGSLLEGVDLVLDGTDNFATRYLLNDWSVKSGIPWIYGACVSARGMTAVIVPGVTPCLRCLFPEPPPPGSAETCDTAGIIAPAANLAASLQFAEALKLLVGDHAALRRTLVSFELWPFRIVEFGGADPAPDPQCPACARREFVFLEAAGRARASAYCGRDAVQLIPASDSPGIDLAALARRLSGAAACTLGDYVLRIEVPGHRITVFDDGRALVGGTSDPERARALYDRLVGS